MKQIVTNFLDSIKKQIKNIDLRRLAIILVLFLLTTGTVSGSVWYIMDTQIKFLQKQIDTILEQNEIIVKEENETTLQPENDSLDIKRANSELISIDDTWNLYKNYDLGISIKIPKKAVSHDGSCRWNDRDNDHSYRYFGEEVPVKVFEDNGDFIIDFEYKYELTGESREGSEENGYKSYFSGCKKVINAYDKIAGGGWHVMTANAKNDNDINDFLSSVNSGCKIIQKDTFNTDLERIIIGADPEWNEETEGKPACFLGGVTMFLYSQERSQIYTWSIGQSVNFWKPNSDPNIITGYDSEMAESFNLI